MRAGAIDTVTSTTFACSCANPAESLTIVISASSVRIYHADGGNEYDREDELSGGCRFREFSASLEQVKPAQRFWR